MTTDEQVCALRLHRLNLSEAATWQEFRAAQVEFVQLMIQMLENEIANKEVIRKFADWKFTEDTDAQ